MNASTFPQIPPTEIAAAQLTWLMAYHRQSPLKKWVLWDVEMWEKVQAAKKLLDSIPLRETSPVNGED